MAEENGYSVHILATDEHGNVVKEQTTKPTSKTNAWDVFNALESRMDTLDVEISDNTPFIDEKMKVNKQQEVSSSS